MVNKLTTYPSTSISDFLERFPDNQACLLHLARARFGVELQCPHCPDGFRLAPTGRPRQVYCWSCKSVVSITADTLAGHSRISLWSWYYLLLLVANRTTGLAVDNVARQLGVSRLASYRMLCLVRMHIAKIQEQTRELIGGPGILVEIDETWLPRIVYANDPHRTGAIVFGIQSEGTIYTRVLPDRRADTLIGLIRRMVRPGSIVVTDSHRSYHSLSSHGYQHITLNHRIGEWARDGYSTANIESYWTSLKYFLRSHNRRLLSHTLPLNLAENSFRQSLRSRGENVFEALISQFPVIDRTTLPNGALPRGRRSRKV